MKVVWTTLAATDLEEIIDYIYGNNPQTAKKLYKKIKESISAIEKFPQQGRIVPELKEIGIVKYRELIVKPWRVMYKIETDAIFILSVIDGRRDFETLLLDILLRDN